jgi:uncharacterized protein (TIGR02246 family)
MASTHTGTYPRPQGAVARYPAARPTASERPSTAHRGPAFGDAVRALFRAARTAARWAQIALVIVGVVAMVAVVVLPRSAAGIDPDPFAVAAAYQTALNAHDLEAVAALFADDASCTGYCGESGDLFGVAAIRSAHRAWAANTDRRLQVRNVQRVGVATVSYEWTLVEAGDQANVLPALAGTNVLGIRAGKIASLEVRIDPAVVQARQALQLPVTWEH